MAVVKGSTQERLSLVRYDPWQRFLRGVYFLLFTAAVAGGCFFAGQYASLNERRVLVAERDQLQEQVVAADQEIRGFSQRVGALEKGGQVDRFFYALTKTLNFSKSTTTKEIYSIC